MAEESNDKELDGFLSRYGVIQVFRRDVPTVQAEIYQAQEAEEELRRQAKEKMRAEKKEEWHKRAAGAHDKIKEEIAKVKSRVTGREQS